MAAAFSYYIFTIPFSYPPKYFLNFSARALWREPFTVPPPFSYLGFPPQVEKGGEGVGKIKKGGWTFMGSPGNGGIGEKLLKKEILTFEINLVFDI